VQLEPERWLIDREDETLLENAILARDEAFRWNPFWSRSQRGESPRWVIAPQPGCR